MKRRFLKILTLLFAMCMTLGLYTACNGEENHVHDYKTIKFDTDGHWYECECGDKVSVAEHTFKDGVCICGYEETEGHTHNFTILKYDTENHWLECECQEKTSVIEHTFVDNTCACGYINSTEHFHDYKNIKYDKDNHWFECVCGDINSVTPHTFVDGVCACGNREDGVHVHDYKNIKYDSDNHWFECACQEKIGVNAHTMVNYACVCGYKENAHTHEYTLKHDTVNHWLECSCQDKKDVTAHKFVNGVCSCGYETTTHIHEFTIPEYDDINHTYKCYCGVSNGSQPHTIIDNACECGYRVSALIIKYEDFYVEVGKSLSIDYEIVNIENQTSVWNSSNSQVCTVSAGKVNGIKEGTSTITLTVGSFSATCTVHVFNYQTEVADTYTTPLEVYNYYHDGNVISNDMAITLADYGLVYNQNVKAVFTNGSKSLTATVRSSYDKLRVYIDLDVLGSTNYGTGYTLVLSSADKKVSIPLSLIVTKYISEKDDLHYLFYFGGMAFNTEYCTYDGYFIQTNDIDMECTPLLNRLPYENHLPDEVMIDTAYPSITGKYQTGKSATTILYTYFNVDVGFKGIYDGNGSSIVNLSLYDDQGGLPRARQPLGGLFGSISRTGVVKNLGITATDTWVWYSYGSAYVLGYNVNGTLENVYVKIKPTLNVATEVEPNPSTGFCVAKCISGATLKNVVFELDIPDTLLREVNGGDIINSRGKANYTGASLSMYDYQGANANTAKNNKSLSRKQTNTFKNCYFFYTNNGGGIYQTTGFECYSYDSISGKTFEIINDSTYFEIAGNGVPTFIGLG